jgi:hypothetical protein
LRNCSDEPRENVGRAARPVSGQDMDWPVRIIGRLCDVRRRDRERSGAGRQTPKITA